MNRQLKERVVDVVLVVDSGFVDDLEFGEVGRTGDEDDDCLE